MPEPINLPVLLWHPDGQRVALKNGAWPELAFDSHKALAPQLEAAWNIKAWLLHDGGLSCGRAHCPRFEALAESLPAGLTWQNHAAPELLRARPWQRAGWPAQAQGLLQEAGLSGTLQQVFSTDLNTVLQVNTALGSAYLKVSDSPAEMRFTAHLGRHFPDLLPSVLGVSESAGWQILADGGELLDARGDLTAWLEALERLAKFQTSADAQVLAEMGYPVYPLAEMQEQVLSFLADSATLRSWGAEPAHIATLQAARPALQRVFGEVAALGLPDLPAHGDAHPRNVLHGERGSLWFDWSETAAQAHPFMDVGWFLAFTFHPRRENLPIRQAHPALEEILTRHYLKVLGCPEAEALLRSAIPLALLHRAAVYDQLFRHWEGTIPGWRPNYTPYYLRLAAGELPRLTS